MVRGLDASWTVMPFAKTYNTPVVVVRSVSQHDAKPGRVDVRQALADRVELRFQSSGDDAEHGKEDAFYMIAEAGRHPLGDLAIEAGRLIAEGTDENRSIRFASPFANAPIVLTSVKTADGEAVDARVDTITVGSFSTAFAAPLGSSQMMDWIAVQEGSSTLKSGRTIEAFSSDVGLDFGSVYFPMVRSNQHPTVVSDVNGAVDATPRILRHANPTGARIRLRLAPEDVLDASRANVRERVGIFVGD